MSGFKFQSTRSMSAACRRYRARQRALQHLIAHRLEQVIEEENGRARVDQAGCVRAYCDHRCACASRAPSPVLVDERIAVLAGHMEVGEDHIHLMALEP